MIYRQCIVLSESGCDHSREKVEEYIQNVRSRAGEVQISRPCIWIDPSGKRKEFEEEVSDTDLLQEWWQDLSGTKARLWISTLYFWNRRTKMKLVPHGQMSDHGNGTEHGQMSVWVNNVTVLLVISAVLFVSRRSQKTRAYYCNLCD